MEIRYDCVFDCNMNEETRGTKYEPFITQLHSSGNCETIFYVQFCALKRLYTPLEL